MNRKEKSSKILSLIPFFLISFYASILPGYSQALPTHMHTMAEMPMQVPSHHQLVNNYWHHADTNTHSTMHSFSAYNSPNHSINLDLSSTNANMTAGNLLHHGSITIIVGGTPLVIDSTTKLTPAEYLAVRQVEFTGQQSLIIDSQGNASGGTLVINSHLNQLINNLVIPQGVTVIDLTKSGTLNLTGNITDNGSLYISSRNPLLNNITVNANNINVLGHGSLSDVIPTGLLSVFHGHNLDSNLNLNLNTINNISNAGSISSGGALTLTAGNTITNAAATTIQAAHTINLVTGSGHITNDGTITSAAGDINISAKNQSTDIYLQSNYGSLQAQQGNINFRDSSYTGSGNIEINGGNYFAQNMNLYSGTGSIMGSTGEITAQLNSYAGNEHFNADTNNLIIGNNCISGDPTYANTGDITLSGLITPTENITIIADGNILGASAFSMNATGIAVTFVAGADITSGGGAGGQTVTNSTPGVVSPVTFQFDSTHSGNIDFSNSGTSPLITDSGGNVTLLANYAATGTGNIWFSTGVEAINTSSNTGTGGNVLIVAGGQGGTALSGPISSSLQIGAISTASNSSNGSNGGNIIIYGANPVITGGSATYDTHGTLTSGSYPTSSSSYTFNSNGIASIGNNLTTSGGTGAAGSSSGSIGGAGGIGGTGGLIQIQAGSISASGSLTSTGGSGGAGGNGTTEGGVGGTGGSSGTINLTAISSLTATSSINASGGGGGSGGTGGNDGGNGGLGGNGGSINISASSVTANLFGSISSEGGVGGIAGSGTINGGSSGNGGNGGSVSITATSSFISVGLGVSAAGGSGGNLGAGAIGGSGGKGGIITMTAASSITISSSGITAAGGNGISADTQGSGGDGGSVTLSANSYLVTGNVTAAGGTPGIGFGISTVGNGGTLSIADSSNSQLNIGSSTGSNYISGQVLAYGENGGRLSINSASLVKIFTGGVVSASNQDSNGTGGTIQFANTTAGGTVSVTNNGTIKVSQSGVTTGIVGFNGGASGTITVNGSGSIRAGQFVNAGNLNPTTLAIQSPYSTVSPFTGTYTNQAGNITITQASISGTLQVSNGPSPSPSSGSSTTTTTASTGLTPQQQLFYLINFLQLEQSLQNQANQQLYEQIGTRIPTDYTPWTTYPMQPQILSQPLLGGITINKLSQPNSAVFAASEFNANELTALTRAGVIFGPASSNNFFDLQKGFVLFMPTSNIQVQTREGLVFVPKGTAAWIMETGNDVAIYDLHDDFHSGNIVVTVNGIKLALYPGKELLLTRNTTANFATLNPGNHLGYRNVHVQDLGNGIKAFACDFSITHSFLNEPMINGVLASRNSIQLKTARKMMKNAAILADLQNHPEYETH